MEFRINEIFTSIQGEGTFTGTPAHFIRFQGCPIGCHFCDSKVTWLKEDGVLFNEDMLIKTISEHAQASNIHHIVLTGGEPMWWHAELPYLIEILLTKGFSVQIETSGIYGNPAIIKQIVRGSKVFVTISPKAPHEDMSEFLPVDSELLAHCFEIKFVVGGPLDIERRIPQFMQNGFTVGWPSYDRLTQKPRVFLQPVDLCDATINKACTQEVVKMAIRYGFGVSAQVHKFLDLR